MKPFGEFIDSQTFTEALVPDSGHSQYGSNPGGLHTDTTTGKKHYVKFYKNGDQAKVEALAGKIYQHMGIHTANPEHHVMDGKHAVSTPWNSNLKPMQPHDFHKLNANQATQVGKMYHAAVLTKNWDIVGLEHDNIMHNHATGDLHAIDHGGAFHFRARGGPKDYGPDIGEHASLRNNHEASGHVFSTVFKQHPHAEREGLKAVHNIDDNHVHNLFANSGLHNWRELHSNFQARKRNLLAKY